MSQAATSLQFASAMSGAAETAAAADEVAQILSDRFQGPADLAVVYLSPNHAEKAQVVASRLARSLRPRTLIGTTCEGVIGVQEERQGRVGMSVLAATLPRVRLSPFNYEQIDWPAVVHAPESLHDAIHTGGAPVRAILLLADPFSTPMVKLLPALNQAFPAVPIIGGMASGARKPHGNRLLMDQQVFQEGAVGIAIAGDLRVDCTVSQGCRPIGRPMVVTKTHRHVILQLGGKRAYDAARSTIEDLNEEDRALAQSSGLLLGRVINEYKDRFGRGDFLIRNLLSADEDQGYLVVNDPQVRTGQTVQFHLHDRRTAIEDFRLLLEAQKLHGRDGGALLFSCNGRGTSFFGQPHTDARLVHEALGDMPLAGCFAAGEIGPVGGRSFLHGHTASLMVLRPGS